MPVKGQWGRKKKMVGTAKQKATKQFLKSQTEKHYELNTNFVDARDDTKEFEAPENEDEDEDVSMGGLAKIQSTLQVQFTTKIKDPAMRCDDTTYALTSKLRPHPLSQVVNHILDKTEEADQVEFDFLINNVLVESSLSQHLSKHEISSEQTVSIEYIEKTIEPSANSSDNHPDWVSCVDALKRNLFITGCYDGIIRVWEPPAASSKKSKSKMVAQRHGHIAPIKGITSLYSQKGGGQDLHYFASAGMDRSIKVFGLNDSTHKMTLCASVDTKTNVGCHRMAVECVSAPYPSKVFATGSADKDIRVYRMTNDDVVTEDKGPAAKKRRLNAPEDAVDVDIEYEDPDQKELELSSCNLKCISRLKAHRDAVKSVDWTQAGHLYSGSWDSSIKMWDVEKEIDLFTWQTQSGVTCVKWWGGQNVIISAHSNLKMCIWDPRTRGNVSTKTTSKATYRSHRLFITGIDVDGSMGDDQSAVRNGDSLFVSSSHDGKLKIWDMRSQSPLYSVDKHKGKALCVGWYGNSIVSGGTDCKFHVMKWNK